MYKTKLLAILSILFSFNCVAQENSDDKKLMDSLIKHDDLMQMLDSLGNPESYAKINIGIGNRLFSVHNNLLNSLQSNNQIIFTPSLAYYHKSGLSISAAAYLLSSNHKTNFYQYSITPAYDYLSGKSVAAGVSYTRFIKKDEYEGATSPIQNDFYGYVYLKKSWIEPGIAVGYSQGNYKEIQTLTLNFPAGPRTFEDTATTKLNAFSLIGTLEHTFDIYSLLSYKDDLSITPTFMINAGSNKYEVTHKNKYSAVVKNRKGRLKRIQSTTSSFQLESLGLSLDLNYTIGNFNLEPQAYLDYYLPKTEEKRFTQIFTFNVGWIF